MIRGLNEVKSRKLTRVESKTQWEKELGRGISHQVAKEPCCKQVPKSQPNLQVIERGDWLN